MSERHPLFLRAVERLGMSWRQTGHWMTPVEACGLISAMHPHFLHTRPPNRHSRRPPPAEWFLTLTRYHTF
jgi:hypothetical protein